MNEENEAEGAQKRARSPELSAEERARKVHMAVCAEVRISERVAIIAYAIREAEIAAEARGRAQVIGLLEAEAATQTGYGDLGDYAEDLAEQARAFVSGDAAIAAL